MGTLGFDSYIMNHPRTLSLKCWNNDCACVRSTVSTGKGWPNFQDGVLKPSFYSKKYEMCSFFRLKRYTIDFSQWTSKSKIRKPGMF